MRDNKKKILIISPNFYPNIGGSEVYFLNITKYFKNLKFLVYSLEYSDQPKNKKLNIDNLQIRRLKWFSGKLKIFFYLKRSPFFISLNYVLGLLPFSIYHFIKDGKDTKLIHCNGIAALFIAFSLRLLFFKKIPIIVTILGLDISIKKNSLFEFFEKGLLNQCEAIYYNTDAIKDEIILRFPQLKDRMIKAKNIYDDNILKILPKKNLFKNIKNKELIFFYNNDFKILLFVGRFAPDKQINFVVKFITDYAKKYKEDLGKICFLFCGRGPLKSEIIKLKKINNLNVIIEHPIYDELVYYYNIADVLLWPSVASKELSMVCIEGMSCGLPVFTSKFSFQLSGNGIEVNSPEVLPKNCLMVDPNNVSKLILQLKLFINKENIKDKEVSAEFAKKNYGLNNLDIYNKFYDI